MHGHAAHSKVHHHSYHVTPAGVAGTGSAGVLQGLDGLDGAIPASPTRPDCSTNVLKCGPPRVDFIGGKVGTHGATGNAIVNVLGRVIGVSITEPGCRKVRAGN